MSEFRFNIKQRYSTEQKKLPDIELRELQGEAASEAVEIFSALFALIALIDFDKREEGRIADFLDTESLSLALTSIGKLGFLLADSCFADIQECLTGYRQLMEEREQKNKTEVRNGN